MPDDQGLRRTVVRSEFGIVAVEVRGAQGRERLRIEDLRTQAAVELDPLELESLAWATHGDLAALLDPGRTRWPSEDPALEDERAAHEH